MYKIKKYKDLSKDTKIRYWIGYGLEFAMIIASLALLIYYIAIGDPHNRIFPTIGAILAFFAPLVMELVFKKRYSLFMHIMYVIVLFFSLFLGCALNFHATIGPYDEISHFSSGYICSLLMFYILAGWKDYDRQKALNMTVCIFLLSMSFASLWEIYEFLADGFLGGSGVGGYGSEVIKAGQALGYSGPKLYFYCIKNGTYLWDSITDMTLHLGGSLVFMVEYIIYRHIKTPIFLERVRRDAVNNKKRYYDFIMEDEVTSTNIASL